MSDLVCAIRGGPGSYQTRLAALQHGADTGSGVRFLSVIDPGVYEPLHTGEQHAIRAEMAWRDLALAKAIAARAHLDDVRFTVTVRVGDLVDTISAFTGEVEADTILIGTPRSAADARFAADGVGEFADELRQRTGAMVMVMSP